MNAPAHHPSPETLVAYAAGTVAAGFDFVVAAHVHRCVQCARDVAALESIGGATLGQGASVDLSADSLAKTLARLDAPTPPEEAPATLDDILARAKRRWVAPGVWVAKVPTPCAPTDRVYMLGAKSGAATARHSHNGMEFTQILAGHLVDGEIVFSAGDFAEHDEDSLHQPRATGGVECVCLFATHGRLRPAGWIGRLAFAIADV